VSLYDVHLAARRVAHEPAFRERLARDPEGTLAEFDLTDDERRLLLAGEVGRLYELGAHEFLLMNFARFGVLGLDRATFSERIRAARR
jgi:Aromatic-ring-opening dioxygenase LigAB, LigA subunit